MSGGYNGGTRKGKPNIAPAMRAAFLAAIKLVEQREGKTLAELMADWLLKDPIAMLNAMSKFSEREERVQVDHDHTLTTESFPATRKFIESVIDQETLKAPSKAIHNQPVAVAPTRLK
jgi:hypothetical protein